MIATAFFLLTLKWLEMSANNGLYRTAMTCYKNYQFELKRQIMVEEGY